MRKSLWGTAASVALLFVSAGALANEVTEVFECKFEKNMTVENAQSINKKWLAFMHANVSEDIRSVLATAVVGKFDKFLYVDTFPDLETWAEAKALLATDEGQAIEGEFAAVMECDENTLYEVHTVE